MTVFSAPKQTLPRWLLAFVVLLVVLTARTAHGAVTIQSLKVHLDIPAVAVDDKLTTKHELELTVVSSPPGTLRLDLYAPDLVATDLTTGRTLFVTKQKNDWYTTISVPNGPQTLKVTFNRPLFENAMPRFWWEETDAELGWPFETTTPRVQNNLDLEVLAPLDMTTPSDLRCVRRGTKKLCSRSFGRAEIARFKAQPKQGVRIGSVANTWSAFALPGASAVLWVVLLIAVAAYRIVTRGAALPGRGWMIGRTLIAICAFVGSVALYAFLVDGELGFPLPTATMYACAVFGCVALMFAQLHRTDRLARSVMGWLGMLAAFPVGLVVAASSKDLMAPFIAAGIVGVGGFAMMYGESSD